jgi:predicted lipoprotein with Yx(FWY)xxD motif
MAARGALVVVMSDQDREITVDVTVRSKGANKYRSRAWVPLASGVLALTAACGAAAYGGTSTASSPRSPAAQEPAAVIGTASTGLGTILVTGEHRTVYEFGADTGSTSHCNSGCSSIWPPVIAPATLPSSLPGVTGTLGSTTRADGTKQLTVAGHPVYTYSGDSAAGQTNGQGLRLNGGLWTVASPAGAPVTGSRPMSPSKSSSESSSNPY